MTPPNTPPPATSATSSASSGETSASQVSGSKTTTKKPGKGAGGTTVCGEEQVKVTLLLDGTAGKRIGKISVTNKEAVPCTMKGAPEVIMFTGKGTPLGFPAEKIAGGQQVTLKQGETATAEIEVRGTHSVPQCSNTPADGLKVTLPGASESQLLAEDLHGCHEEATLMTVKPFVK